ncbi:MAG: TIGR02206 family membrane protein [Clostridia bacterium]|nr:TIGR02206 family membrane protein [Clostridia bacterium]
MLMLKEFFDINSTSDPGFKLYDSVHFIWLAAIVLACVVCCIVYKRASDKGKRVFGLVMGISIVALEVLKDAILLLTGDITVNHLPLHLCGLSIMIEFAHSIRPSKFAKELMYALCMPGALAALVFPNWTTTPICNFFHVHSFLIHALLVIYPIMIIAAGEHRPSVKRLPKCLGFLVAAGIPIYFLNKLIDTNFMFLNWPSEGSPLVWFEGLFGNPGYLLGFPILIALVWLVLYTPFVIADVISAKKREQE